MCTMSTKYFKYRAYHIEQNFEYVEFHTLVKERFTFISNAEWDDECSSISVTKWPFTDLCQSRKMYYICLTRFS